MGNVLDHLLKIEADASALVSGAQEEADRRIHENEEKNRIAFEEKIRLKYKSTEERLINDKKIVNAQYQKALEEYKKELSRVKADEQKFFALLNEYIANLVCNNV